jgi:hypothetical protein
MKEDFTMSQGEGLSTVADLAMQGGICFALTTEWGFLLLKGKSFEPIRVQGMTWKQKGNTAKFQRPEQTQTTVEVQEGFYSLVSRQRGYDLVDLNSPLT